MSGVAPEMVGTIRSDETIEAALREIVRIASSSNARAVIDIEREGCVSVVTVRMSYPLSRRFLGVPQDEESAQFTARTSSLGEAVRRALVYTHDWASGRERL